MNICIIECKCYIAKFNDMNKLLESKEDKIKFRNWIKNGASKSFSDLPEDRLDTFADRITDTFIEYKQRLKSPYNDFYYWMKNSNFEDFYNYIRELQAKVGQDKLTKEKEKDGARLVYSDDTWKVYEITTYEASAKYGKGTKWCISGSKRWANGERGSEYFDDYYSQNGVKFYFFINKDGNKYALAVYPDNSCEIFNAEDVAIPFIPNAPIIDEIKTEYRNESDSNILVNAIMNKKLPEDVLMRIIQETFNDNTGFDCTIYTKNNVNDLIAEVDSMIPDGYLETTDNEEDWEGDLPYFAFGELEALGGRTKEEKLKSLKRILKDEAEYVVLEESNDGWMITPLKDYTQLFMWANDRCNIYDWSDGELDDFFINSLDSEDLEHLHGGRAYVFPIMLANRLIWDITNGNVSGSVLNGIGLSTDYMKHFREDLDKIYLENKKVSENVCFEGNNGDVYYHGSVETDLQVLNKPINWITKDYNYAKTFATENGYVYECSANLDNLFNVGKTDARVYDLIPVKPYRFSREFTNIIRRLNLSESVVKRIIDNIVDEYDLDADGYKLTIRLVVRAVAFKRILEGLGYNGIQAIEYDSINHKNVETFGLFDNVKVLGKVEESLDEEKAITWGDLDYAKKTDTRRMMSGRGTGHFGTGFYFVGKDGPYGLDKDNNIKGYDYEPSRPIYEIELDNYNLYKPKDNDSAYRLHDTLKEINDGYEPSLDIWLNSNFDEEALEDELFNIGWTLVDEDLDDDDIDLDFNDFNDLLNKDEESKDYEDAVKEQDKSLDNYRKLVKEFITKYGLDEYVWKDIDTMKSGEIERHVEDAIHYKARNILGLRYALKTLSKMFNVDEKTLLDIIHKAYESNSEDSISTMLMKGLGYEGVDVTHLNHDDQGLSGLDNFGYGTVVYDLKPGTFKKIADPRKIKKEDLKEYFEKIEDKGEKWYGYDVMDDCPLYVTDEPYRIKSMLEKGDTPYRIYNASGVYLIQDARGNKTHSDMYRKAMGEYFITFEQAYGEVNGYNGNQDYLYMVFIPTDFDGELRWHTKLGVDSYYDCRVYDFGVIFVRDKGAYENSLFKALGEPEREVTYLRYERRVDIKKNDTLKEISIDDLKNNPNNAITYDVDSISDLDDDARIPVDEDYEPTDEDFPYTLDDICREYPDLISNNYESCGNAFIMPDGRFILSGDKFDTHEDFAFDTLLKLGDFESEEEIEDTWDTDEILRAFTRYFDLVRVNDGSRKYIENRAYFVIPKNTLTSGQQNALLSYLDVVLGNKFRNKTYDIQAYAGRGLAHHTWDVDDTDVTSDKILDDTKFALSRGFFGESLNEMKGKGNIDNAKIKQYFDECVEEMKKIRFDGAYDFLYLTYDDIDLQIGDALHTFGTMKMPTTKNGNFTLVLNKFMFEEPEEAIKNTILHELCHYVVDKMAIEKDLFIYFGGNWHYNGNRIREAKEYKGHGRVWKYVAAKVGKATGQVISRTDSYKTHTGVGAEAQNRYKYMFRCKGCGNEFGYMKKTKFIDTYMDMSKYSNKPMWSCPKCGAGTHDGDEPPFEMTKGN